MGGTPRKPAKPRPSYEDGHLRDETIAECQDQTYNFGNLAELIKKAVKAPRSR